RHTLIADIGIEPFGILVDVSLAELSETFWIGSVEIEFDLLAQLFRVPLDLRTTVLGRVS
ncbi:hypothetical protein A2U01_0101647, partial [Trifolium medium]|nr:hypothetical protein [Trifolium medium]